MSDARGREARTGDRSRPLTPEVALRLRATEADLVTGAIALDAYARHGLPAALDGPGMTPPAELLRRVFDNVSPADLTYPTRVIWKAAAEAYRSDTVLTWHAILARVPDGARADCVAVADRERGPDFIGLGIAYYTPRAANLLLQYRSYVSDFAAAQEAAAAALEAISAALEGVA